jgi:hypothetical protein
MTRHGLAILIAVSLFGSMIARPDAQHAADFSGRWVLDDPEAASTGPRRPFCGRDCEISQTASTLTVTVGARSTTYEPDDIVRRTAMTGSRSPIEVSTRAKWDRGSLVIITKVGTQPEAMLRVALEGDKLAVESTDAGFASPGVTLRTLYRRAPSDQRQPSRSR